MLENNFKGTIRRWEGRNEEIHEGDIITIGQHWTKGYNPECNLNGEYVYEIECKELEGHEVNYDILDEDSEDYNEEYADTLHKEYGISYEDSFEEEVIVAEQQYKVVYVYDREEDEFTGGYLPQGIIVERV